jgi:hypothetical protein
MVCGILGDLDASLTPQTSQGLILLPDFWGKVLAGAKRKRLG